MDSAGRPLTRTVSTPRATFPRPSPVAASDEGPVFVLGAPRSGTSLVYRCLALHPSSAWISNYVRRAPWFPELAVLNRVAARAPRSRARAWFGSEGADAYRYGQRRGARERGFPQPVEGEPVFSRRGLTPVVEGSADASAARAANALASDFARLRRASGGLVVVSKRIDHNRRVTELAAVFPRARFVVVTRDGRAVARSLRRVDWWPDFLVWWFGGTPRDWERDGGDAVELAARHWVREVESIETAVSGLSPDRVHHLRYEDLVAAPASRLGGLAAFAGLDPASEQWLRDLGAVRFPDRNAVGPALLGAADEERRVVGFQETTLMRLGYL